MKLNTLRTVMSVLLTGGLSLGCTHFVVNDGAAQEKANADRRLAENMVASAPMAIQQPMMAPQLPPTIAAVPAPPPPKVPEQVSKPIYKVEPTLAECTPNSHMNSKHYINNDGSKVESVRVRATGYGAPPKAYYSDPQRRLMAMRAAKIDAYRSLAERVKGLQIWGGTTIGDMVIEKDRFRVFLDTYLVGAKVIAENPNEDGTFETVVELKVGEQFLTSTLPTPAPKPAHDPCAEQYKQANHQMQGNFIPATYEPRYNGSHSGTDFYFDRD